MSTWAEIVKSVPHAQEKCLSCGGDGTYLYTDSAPGPCPDCDATGWCSKCAVFPCDCDRDARIAKGIEAAIKAERMIAYDGSGPDAEEAFRRAALCV